MRVCSLLFLSPTGHVVITNPESLPGTSVDAAFAWLWTQIFPWMMNTPSLYYMVYLGTPIIGLLIAAFILKPRAFFGLAFGGHR
jgi:hypothetical protein